MNELQALQNAADNIGAKVHQMHLADKRRKAGLYFVTIDGTTISPTLDYDQLNHFILGYIKGMKAQKAVKVLPDDLFEADPKDLPTDLQAVLRKYEDLDATYQTCNRLIADLNAIGYTCEYGLDAVPYDLHKMTSAEELLMICQELSEEALCDLLSVFSELTPEEMQDGNKVQQWVNQQEAEDLVSIKNYLQLTFSNH